VPRDAVGDAIADLLGGVNLLYFDEFHVHDSGDAVLISRVLEAVFARGITLLATSNYHPADLLPSPAFHDLIEPAIALLETHVDIVELGGTVDFRRAGTAGAVVPPVPPVRLVPLVRLVPPVRLVPLVPPVRLIPPVRLVRLVPPVPLVLLVPLVLRARLVLTVRLV
jgi:AFG1-like ATPase